MVVTLVVGDKTHSILGHNLFDLLVGVGNHLLFLLRDDNIAEVERQTALECHTVTHSLDVVEEVGSHGVAADGEQVTNDVTQRLLAHHLIDEAISLRDHLVIDDTAYGSTETVGLDVVAVLVNDRVAILVAQNFEFGTATLSAFLIVLAVTVGEDIALTVLNDFGE